ncbi:isoflavone reductase family protein [Colletotrichum truncatum]|uniref:Isoflavone reductase family protein n=1 Tax=Colletotrichum truncatum TaxID=5467 RepID=A0ACC3YJZ2_COLTU|nr:isoflavone reductase family protein [Colletotrichum truncatum]KAF6797430.1 isoflavone reductase family protein [Colletotrichum truncatum]
MSIRVAIVGATGETGGSITNALLESTDVKFWSQEVTALARPESIQKPAYTELKQRSVTIVPANLNGPQDDLVKVLRGIDVVVSAIAFTSLSDEIPLANASKAAGVKRFVQSALMVVIPPRGVVDFREKKDDILSHILKIRLPYTYIDAGWWYQIAFPRLPSGKIDYAIPSDYSGNLLGADGNVPIALADIRDVGRYVARVIADPRTINKKVFVYSEVLPQNQIYEAFEKASGEKLERQYISETELLSNIEAARSLANTNPENSDAVRQFVKGQLLHSIAIRGDNTPENAEYLGYLDGKALYPDFPYIKFDDFVGDLLIGKAKGVYNP